MRNFRTLKSWQKAHSMVLSIYDATLTFPQHEIYGLVSQLRRAVSSVATNIAEGCGCNSNREFARFLEIAVRSASETEYQLLLSRDLEYLDIEKYTVLNEQVTEVKRMLTGFIQKLNTES